MAEREARRVLISGKVDLDTVATGFILDVDRYSRDNVEVIRSGQASETDLADPDVICIEVGGSGRVMETNFDHHDPDGPKESATLQALNLLANDCPQLFEKGELPKLFKLATYIDILDVSGAKSLPSYGQVEFPTLSDIFAGMVLVIRDPVEQFHRGIEILRTVIETGQNPFGTIGGFSLYAEAKLKNNLQVAEAVKSAQWATTKSGRKLGFLETDFYGAPGALYGLGAEVVVAFAPRFGNPPAPKFTIGGNGVKVNLVLPILNKLENGWGGPPTGTIIGSPREGSKLSLKEVVDIVSANL